MFCYIIGKNKSANSKKRNNAKPYSKPHIIFPPLIDEIYAHHKASISNNEQKTNISSF
ncbi:hypothetical protein NTHI1209_00302 [Haemophilus influenzae]|uniref:Uncharacterized protein n=1 Tax=Haemophilus influenzae TaxID=727 RepID=A0A158SV06_HAEIF|nr:hypothetical protein NTHI1209_00302 [Haemophilus influenzae]